jgi:hypothetical protein
MRSGESPESTPHQDNESPQSLEPIPPHRTSMPLDPLPQRQRWVSANASRVKLSASLGREKEETAARGTFRSSAAASTPHFADDYRLHFGPFPSHQGHHGLVHLQRQLGCLQRKTLYFLWTSSQNSSWLRSSEESIPTLYSKEGGGGASCASCSRYAARTEPVLPAWAWLRTAHAVLWGYACGWIQECLLAQSPRRSGLAQLPGPLYPRENGDNHHCRYSPSPAAPHGGGPRCPGTSPGSTTIR